MAGRDGVAVNRAMSCAQRGVNRKRMRLFKFRAMRVSIVKKNVDVPEVNKWYLW